MDLYKAISIEWDNGPVPGSFFGVQIFRHFTKNLEEWAISDPGMLKYFGVKSLYTQSHRQSIMSFFRSRYKIKGLYYLDEPETALSLKTLIELLKTPEKNRGCQTCTIYCANPLPHTSGLPGCRYLQF